MSTTIAVVMTNVFSGGTVRHALEMTKAWSRQSVRVVFVTTVGRLTQITVFQNGDSVEWYNLWDDKEGKELLSVLRAYQVQLLHVEHLLDADPIFLELHRMLAVPLVVTLHDYYTMCPFIKLTNEEDEYCGEEGIASCEACLKRRDFYSPTTRARVSDISGWRKLWEDYLSEASLVVVPSEDMKRRVQSYFPHIHIQMVENPELGDGKQKGRVVGLIGTLGNAKGARKIQEVLAYCAAQSIPIHFVLFGTLADVTLTEEQKKYITILGAYREEEIYDWIRWHPVDFFWFPGVWPETYSYTLSIPVRMGIPSVSTDLGAIASRILSHDWGVTYPWKADATEIVRKLEVFDYEKYQNPHFRIRNTSFGAPKDYYGDIWPIDGSQKGRSLVAPEIPEVDVFPQICDKLSKAEFNALWEMATIRQKICLMKYIDWEWLRHVFREKGCWYIVRKIHEKVFKK